MDKESLHGEKTRKPVSSSRMYGCPVGYYRCEKCLHDEVSRCCPIGSSCMCRDGYLDMCETI